MTLEEVLQVQADHTPEWSGVQGDGSPDHCPACTSHDEEWVNATMEKPCVLYRLASLIRRDVFHG